MKNFISRKGAVLFLTFLSNLKNTLNIANLPTGLYFVKITTEQDEVVKKVIKQ